MVEVEEGEVAIVECLNDGRASGRRLIARCLGEPGGVVGVEVPHDDGGVMGVEKEGEVGAVMGVAG